MHYRNHRQGFGLVAIVIHWLMAITILGLFGLGLWMTELTYYDPWYRQGPNLHKSIGILVAIIWLFRLMWRFLNINPMPIETIPRWEQLLAGAAHIGLYLLMILVMMSGYFISTADGRPIEVFNWFAVPAWVTPIENQEDIAGEVHFYLACGLIGLATIHAGAALKHHFWDKDATFIRMLNPNYSSKTKNR